MEQVRASCIREYMSGVDRTNRDYKTQEVFTPDWMVDLILEELPNTVDLDSVVLDRAVGDGQFASNILMRKMLHYQENYNQTIHDSFVTALDSIFGIDLEPENVKLCRERLLCGCTDPEVVALVNRRIIVGNTLAPGDRIAGQTDQDHQLMRQYFNVPINLFSD